ncbi:type III secretion system chaperone [Chitinimonas lacunae]|uniref:Type III secretion system chaperone n=1 Tax=Chitinimonas lacunae TaxID=1963018 RepID=A0ABV8MN29_9NEIS
MNPIGQFQELVTALGQALRLKLGAIDTGTRSVEVQYEDGSNVVLSCLEERGEISLSSELCFAPTGERLQALSLALLSDHAFGVETNGVYFAFNKSAGKFLVFSTHPLRNLDGDTLRTALNSLIRTRLQWRKAYDQGHLGQAAELQATIPACPVGFNFA